MFCIFTWLCLGRWLKLYKKRTWKIWRSIFFLISENAITGGISGCVERRYVVFLENKTLLDIDFNIFHGLGMPQPLRYAEIKYDNTLGLKKWLFNLDKSDTGYTLEVDLKLTDKTKTHSWTFHFVQRKYQLKILIV